MLESGLPDVIDDEEPLARFVYERSKFNTSGAKPAAFVPPQNGELSVARHGATPSDELTQLAKDYVPEKVAYGAAIVTALQVRSAGLKVEPHEPPFRHANVLDWPCSSDPEEQKAQRKQKALELASKSTWVSFEATA